MTPEQIAAVGTAVGAVLGALGGWRIGRGSVKETHSDDATAKAVDRASERVTKAIEGLGTLLLALYQRSGRE